ncbi:hypothetical protein TNCV_2289491 [Trichonephila clavipes]|uniref:Uncharacterized protein n=1 Tax=Trichonephila clavipes TaxID=2585209 RepID=A0A8X6V7L0_TRICX|nr:hypothetical protein TNCV_2289491 [Trichonephila clavipes]
MQALSTRRAIGMRSWKPITRIVDEFDEGMDISRIVQPLRSPDLNPMEHINDGLGKVISQCSSLPASPLNKSIAPLLEPVSIRPPELLALPEMTELPEREIFTEERNYSLDQV